VSPERIGRQVATAVHGQLSSRFPHYPPIASCMGPTISVVRSVCWRTASTLSNFLNLWAFPAPISCTTSNIRTNISFGMTRAAWRNPILIASQPGICALQANCGTPRHFQDIVYAGAHSAHLHTIASYPAGSRVSGLAFATLRFEDQRQLASSVGSQLLQICLLCQVGTSLQRL